MQRISKIILFKNNKVLLQLRDNKPNISYPNTWSLVGGSVEMNETSEQAMIRETEEEISLKLNRVNLISSKIKKDENGIEFEENIFSTELLCDVKDLTLREGKEIRLFSLEELDRINIRSVFKEAIINFVCNKE